MRLRISTLVATTLLGLVVGLTTPAYAETSRATDSSGDVVAYYTGGHEASPENTDADILTSVIKHSKARVVATLKLRDLQPRTEGFYQVTMRIKTNKGSYSSLLIAYEDSSPSVTLYKGSKSVRCSGKVKKLSSRLDLARISIPRSCLGKPRWIKVGLGVYRPIGAVGYVDDARRVGFEPTDKLRMTPKLKRG